MWTQSDFINANARPLDLIPREDVIRRETVDMTTMCYHGEFKQVDYASEFMQLLYLHGSNVLEENTAFLFLRFKVYYNRYY